LKRLLLLTVLPLLLIAAGDPPEQGGDADLQAELDALFREIDGGRIPLLEPDRAPDLLIVSTRQVLGEVAPCG